jgi:hypothetical protein
MVAGLVDNSFDLPRFRTKFIELLDTVEDEVVYVNLSGLASLCLLLNINYYSPDVHQLLKVLIDDIRRTVTRVTELKFDAPSTCKFIKEPSTVLSEGMEPIRNFFAYDEGAKELHLSEHLAKILDMLGYTRNQLFRKVADGEDLMDLVPLQYKDRLQALRNTPAYIIERYSKELDD